MTVQEWLQKNPITRRIVNLPKTISNIGKLLWHPISDIEKSVDYRGRTHRVAMVVFVFAPLTIIYLLARTKLGRKVLHPITPKLGDFFQHSPKRLAVEEPKTFSSEREFPKLSIVTPSFQQGQYLERTIQSVLNQNYPNLQYVVQDGGSTDASVEILQRYDNKLHGWESAKDEGQTHALNVGFSKVPDGEIMAYLNSDDLLLPNSIFKIVEFFESNPDVDVIYGNRVMIDEEDLCIGRWVLHGHDDKVLSFADYVPQETMFWRRSIWEKAGGCFDENYRFAMDWDLILRFRRAQAKFAHLPYFLGAFRIHTAQKTSSIINELGEKEMMQLRTRELGYKPSQGECFYQTLPFLLRHALSDFKSRHMTKSIFAND